VYTCRFGVVVDRKTLNKVAITVASTFATIVPVVLALKPDTTHQEYDGAACSTLSETQQAILTSFKLVNSSCSYNITVNGVEVN